VSTLLTVFFQVHNLSGDELKKRDVAVIDIANDPVQKNVSNYRGTMRCAFFCY